MKIHTCQTCRQKFHNKSTARVYCSEHCRLEHARRERAHRLAEFKWIAGTDTWENIANRLGFVSIVRLRDWLRDQDEDAWADRVTELARIERQGRWAA